MSSTPIFGEQAPGTRNVWVQVLRWLLALLAGVVIAVFISEDGKSNWLEGAELLAVYLILALAFFLLRA